MDFVIFCNVYVCVMLKLSLKMSLNLYFFGVLNFFRVEGLHQHSKILLKSVQKIWRYHDFFRFLPREAMLSAVYAVVVCLSVCLCVSHTPVLYQNG